MQRQPVPSDGRPYCYGFDFERTHATCRVCPYAGACSKVSARWDDRLSISKALVQAEAALHPAHGLDLDVEMPELYARVYELYFGRRPVMASVQSPSRASILSRLRVFCIREDIDVTFWIAANMAAMQQACKTGRVGAMRSGFQPNMLVGEGARRRYNIAITKLSKLRRVVVEELLLKYSRARVQHKLVACEQSVGEMYVASWVIGKPMTWLEARRAVKTSLEWRGMQRDSALARYVMLQAAFYVVSRYKVGLADYVGLQGEFSWEALARLMRDVFGGRTVQEKTTGTVASEWTPGGAK